MGALCARMQFCSQNFLHGYWSFDSQTMVSHHTINGVKESSLQAILSGEGTLLEENYAGSHPWVRWKGRGPSQEFVKAGEGAWHFSVEAWRLVKVRGSSST